MVEDWEVDSVVAITIATIFAVIQLVFYGYASWSAFGQFYNVYYNTRTEQSEHLIPKDIEQPDDNEQPVYKPLPGSDPPVEPPVPV